MGTMKLELTKEEYKRVKIDEEEYPLANDFDIDEEIDIEQKDEKQKLYSKGIKEESIKYYLEEISRYKLLSFEEEKELSRRIIEENDQKALEKLINSNLRLVVKISRHYMSKEYPFIDIIQDGNMGLIKAASKYDYKKNVRFSTYASWWIKQTIVRNLSIKKRMIKLSHRKEEKLRKIKKAINKFLQKNKLMPTNADLSKALKIPEKEIKEILSIDNKILSIEESVYNEEQDFVIKNILGDESYVPDTIVENDALIEETKKVLDILNPRERVIITFRYGFNGESKKYTLKKMGEMFGISAETVRQIEIRALERIKRRFPYLKDYLN